MFDLVILSADKDQESALKGLLDSPQKLGIHPIHYKTITHPHRDPGCLRQSHDLLRPFLTSARYSLVVLDVEGSGSGHSQRAGVEAEVEQLLSQNGWNERVRCIAILPNSKPGSGADLPICRASLAGLSRSRSTIGWRVKVIWRPVRVSRRTPKPHSSPSLRKPGDLPVPRYSAKSPERSVMHLARMRHSRSC